MKIQCPCGHIVHDGTDEVPHKARFIPDRNWNTLLESLDWLIETHCQTPKQRDEACTHLRLLITDLTRSAWQCHACGRMYIEDAVRDVHCYPPGPPGTARELFQE